MGTKKDVESLRIFRQELNKSIPIERMILFGSRARGKTSRWSDFDLLIVSPSFRKKKFRYRPLGFHQHWHLDYPVDFLCYTPEEFKRLSKQATIVRDAAREGIEIK